MYFARGAAPLPYPSVQSLIPRLGRVSAGRFNPDGRVIFSAAWDGQPLEIFAQSPGSLEAQPLGLRDMALLGVSATGELAVLLQPNWLPYGRLFGTLALVPGAGGKPREVAENVVWADWSPTGELAIVRTQGGRMQLEYPPGRVLYEYTGYIWDPRVSPSGDLVAFFDGALKLVDRKGQVRSLTTTAVFGTGLAWSPNGEEVWFCKFRSSSIWAVNTRTGALRQVYQGVFEMQLEDISKGGRVLVDAMEARWDVAFAPPGGLPDVRLSVYDSTLVALSDDGREVLFNTRGPELYLRPTDGGAPLKLGKAHGLALSPDARWVLAKPEASNELVLLPVGPGAVRTVDVAGIIVEEARFFQDGNHLALLGGHFENPDEQFNLYGLSLDGGAPVLIVDGGIFGFYPFQISRDGRFVAAQSVDQFLTLYPTDGGMPIPLTELGKLVAPVAWTPEGRLWVRPGFLRGLPTRILLYDIDTRRVLDERPFSLNDGTGILAVDVALGTPDAGAIAFDYERVLGHLFLLDGLAPPGH